MWEPLEESRLRNLEDQKPMVIPPENGPLSARKLRDWVHGAIDVNGLGEVNMNVSPSHCRCENNSGGPKPEHIATLLYHCRIRAPLEIDGFGFIRRTNAYKGEYHVYKRTGDYRA